MNKISGDLIIEITRRCQLECPHCLRGPAQEQNINYFDMERTVKQFDTIGCITFTGGEPSLNPEAIKHFLGICKKFNISVDSFYIATNAVEATKDFLLAVFELYLYCEDNEMSSLDISNDEFHYGQFGIKDLEAFKFTRKKYKDGERTQTYDREGTGHLINEGNYFDNYNDGRVNHPEVIGNMDQDLFEESGHIGNEIRLMLNCNGDIILGCDWSYESQEDHILCNSSDSIHTAIAAALVVYKESAPV